MFEQVKVSHSRIFIFVLVRNKIICVDLQLNKKSWIASSLMFIYTVICCSSYLLIKCVYKTCTCFNSDPWRHPSCKSIQYVCTADQECFGWLYACKCKFDVNLVRFVHTRFLIIILPVDEQIVNVHSSDNCAVSSHTEGKIWQSHLHFLVEDLFLAKSFRTV